MCLTGLVVSLGFFSVATSSPAAEPMAGGILYRLTNDSETTVSSAGKDPVTNRTLEITDFRLARKGDRVELAIDRITRSTTTNGQEVFHVELSRSGMIRQERGENKVFDRAGSNPEMVAMFDLMGAPIAIFTLDAEGAEVSREVKASGALLGSIVIIRSLYPSFPKGRAEWDVKPSSLQGPGVEPRGMLHYRKRPAASPDGSVEVDVSGMIDLAGKMGTADLKRGQYEVKGVQTYDPALGDWAAGKLTTVQDLEFVMAGGITQVIKTRAVQTLIRLDGPGTAAKAKQSP
jgi:hypothetical protein